MAELTDLNEIKARFGAAIKSGDSPAIAALARTLMSQSPTLGTAAQVIKNVPLDLPNRQGLSLKIAFLRSFTIEPVIPLLRALARLHGIDLVVKVGEFNSYTQEIIDPNSWLYEFEPNVVILAAQTRDVAPDLWQESNDLPTDGVEEVVGSIAAPILSLVAHLRRNSNASMIVHSFEEPERAIDGLLDARREVGQAETIHLLNRRLIGEALRQENVYVLDYPALVARYGRESWHDEKKWLTSRAPIASDYLIRLAEEYLRFILPISGRVSKVLVVDLDNTLWGGVVGEDGINGVKIGSEYPGAAYLSLQRAILDLHRRGVLLAICSKNNYADAMEVLETRPEMLLRPSHFAAIRINWVDKAQNLRQIAEELNVGIDSLAFIDDNPVERERVKIELPEVFVVDLPDDPMEYARALRAAPVFERLSLTAEDRTRGRYYAEQRERRHLESSAGTLEDFYRSLEMRADFVDVKPETVARIAQLTQKTNQLNTTTHRFTEAEVLAMAGDSRWKIFGIKVSDRFGDNGLVGVVILEIVGADAIIDTFLLSCRVIGRTVETVMLAKVYDIAIEANCARICGWFHPTRKNAPASKIYSLHGFEAVKETEDGILWCKDVLNAQIAPPEWIKIGTEGQ